VIEIILEKKIFIREKTMEDFEKFKLELAKFLPQ